VNNPYGSEGVGFFNIREERDVFDVTNIARKLALDIGLSRLDSGLFCTATSEIATNAIRYGVDAKVVFRLCKNNKGVEVHITDRGGGIGDLNRAMTDGHSSAQSYGIGLGAAKRSVDEMEVDTGSQGTSVILRKYKQVPSTDIDFGVVSFPAVDNTMNGDGYFIKSYHGDSVLACVMDGGRQCYQTGSVECVHCVNAVLRDNYTRPLNEILQLCDESVKRAGYVDGISIAIVRITPECVETTIVGSIQIFSYPDVVLDMEPCTGLLGKSMPEKIPITCIPRPPEFNFSLYSDGLVNVNYVAIPAESSVQRFTEILFDHHAKADDDSTILVLAG